MSAAAALPGIPDEVNLDDSQEVMELGRGLSKIHMAGLVELIRAMAPANRSWFFLGLLSPINGCMVSALGHDETARLHDDIACSTREHKLKHSH